jgi:hypothetical protein
MAEYPNIHTSPVQHFGITVTLRRSMRRSADRSSGAALRTPLHPHRDPTCEDEDAVSSKTFTVCHSFAIFEVCLSLLLLTSFSNRRTL